MCAASPVETEVCFSRLTFAEADALRGFCAAWPFEEDASLKAAESGNPSLTPCKRRTLIVVLAPHENAAPVREVVGNDGQPIPPGLHHRLHVVEAGVAAQVCRLKSGVDLRRFLQLDDLLRRLERKDPLGFTFRVFNTS